MRGAALTSGPLPWLLGLAATALVASHAIGDAVAMPGYCGSLGAAAIAGRAALLLSVASPVAILLSWLIMLAAMMPPLLAEPVRHIRQSSFPRRRPRALALFAVGYVVVWLSAGIVLLPTAVLARIVVPDPWAGMVLVTLALVWSCTPAAQSARNRCHRTRRIGAFGWGADRDCLAYGLTTGASCTAACWPWMTASVALDRFHLIGMSMIAILLLLERFGPSRTPSWQMPPALTVLADLWKRQKVLGSRYPSSSMMCQPETLSSTSALSRSVSL